jgi:hypothetical protein
VGKDLSIRCVEFSIVLGIKKIYSPRCQKKALTANLCVFMSNSCKVGRNLSRSSESGQNSIRRNGLTASQMEHKNPPLILVAKLYICTFQCSCATQRNIGTCNIILTPNCLSFQGVAEKSKLRGIMQATHARACHAKKRARDEDENHSHLLPSHNL